MNFGLEGKGLLEEGFIKGGRNRPSFGTDFSFNLSMNVYSDCSMLDDMIGITDV